MDSFTLQSLIRDVNKEMESYRLFAVVPRLVAFIDDLTNWYVRLSRKRFWKSDDDHDKANAYATLYTVLSSLKYWHRLCHLSLKRLTTFGGSVDAQAPKVCTGVIFLKRMPAL